MGMNPLIFDSGIPQISTKGRTPNDCIHPADTFFRPPGSTAPLPLRPVRRRMLRPLGPVSSLREGRAMTLQELSRCYEEAAVPLRARLRELRILLARAEDPEEIWHLKRRIAELTPMLTQMNELAELTAHYYERGYYRNEKYTL